MSLLRIERVLGLPETFEPSTMYINKVENGSEDFLVELWFTGADSIPVRVFTRDDANTDINDALSNFNNILIVEDIQERDSLDITHSTLVLVRHAEDDVTVTTGAALYVSEGMGSEVTFHKVAEYESMDVNFSWDNIQGKPNSSAFQIDTAVDNSHTHENMSELQKIGENAQGQLTYNGNGINANVSISDW